MLKKKIKEIIKAEITKKNGYIKYFKNKIYHSENDQLINRLITGGIFEADIVKTLNNLMTPKTVYYDIGANLGLLSVPFLDQSDIIIRSIEASPQTWKYLQKTWQNSGYQSIWEIYHFAMSQNDGIVDFYSSDHGVGAFEGIRVTDRNLESHKISIQSVKLDTFWMNNNRERVSILKIDVEGGEIDVIKGGLECIRENQPIMICEFDPDNFISYDLNYPTIYNFLKSIDYEIYMIPDYHIPNPYFRRVTSITDFSLSSCYSNNYILFPSSYHFKTTLIK